MTNKKLKLAAMSVALTACVAAQPMAAHAVEGPDSVEDNAAPQAEPVAESPTPAPVAEEGEKQEEAGADYLDINTALCAEKELETMLWVIGLAMEHSACGIMIDSPSTTVLKEAMAACKGRKLIVNSFTITDRREEIAPLLADSGAGVVGMPVGGAGDRASLAGVDVSSHQGTVDWAQVAAEGIDFVIIRCGGR